MNAINELPQSRLQDEINRVFALQQARKIELRQTTAEQRLENCAACARR